MAAPRHHPAPPHRHLLLPQTPVVDINGVVAYQPFNTIGRCRLRVFTTTTPRIRSAYSYCNAAALERFAVSLTTALQYEHNGGLAQ